MNYRTLCIISGDSINILINMVYRHEFPDTPWTSDLKTMVVLNVEMVLAYYFGIVDVPPNIDITPDMENIIIEISDEIEKDLGRVWGIISRINVVHDKNHLYIYFL